MEDKEELYDPENVTKAESQNGRRESPRRRSRSPVRRSRSRSRSPRNWRRSERDHRRSREREPRRPIREGPGGKVRLYVCNMPYDIKWQELKDVFKREVGSAVTYVELYETPDGKASGTGAVEVKGVDGAEKAISKMDRFEMNGRKIIVREERDKDRLRHRPMGSSMGGGGGMGGGMGGGGGGGGGGNMGMNMGGGGMGMGGGNNMGGGGSLMGGSLMGGDMGGGMNMGGMTSSSSNHGINPQLLQQLGVDPNNVTNQVFVANLDYGVNEKKIREIFKMAGTITDVDLKADKEGKSRGFCVIRFEHAVEAVQAISMFNGQVLYDRTMTVKMDKMGENTYSQQQIPNKLPTGLKSIGMGLGSGGTPVNVQQLQSNMIGGSGMLGMNSGMGMNNMGNMGMSGMGTGNMGGMGTGMGNMGGLSNMGTGGSLSTGNMGTGMTATGMGTGNMGSLGMGTGLGTGGMGGGGGGGGGMGMSMNTMSGSGMGSNLGGMGDLSGTSMGMRTGMGNQSGMAGMGTGMGMNDMNTNMGMNTGMGMGMGSSLNNMGGSSMGGGMGLSSNMGGGSMGMGNMDRYGSGNRDSGRDSGNQDSTTIFVRNLPFSFGWQDLKNKFSSCGDVRFAEVKVENGKSKGYGTVKFNSSDDARRAVNLMNGARIDGRQIEVRLNRV